MRRVALSTFYASLAAAAKLVLRESCKASFSNCGLRYLIRYPSLVASGVSFFGMKMMLDLPQYFGTLSYDIAKHLWSQCVLPALLQPLPYFLWSELGAEGFIATGAGIGISTGLSVIAWFFSLKRFVKWSFITRVKIVQLLIFLFFRNFFVHLIFIASVQLLHCVILLIVSYPVVSIFVDSLSHGEHFRYSSILQ